LYFTRTPVHPPEHGLKLKKEKQTTVFFFFRYCSAKMQHEDIRSEFLAKVGITYLQKQLKKKPGPFRKFSFGRVIEVQNP